MKTFGIWILLTFGLYYIISLITRTKNTLGCIILGGILALGIVLVL